MIMSIMMCLNLMTLKDDAKDEEEKKEVEKVEPHNLGEEVKDGQSIFICIWYMVVSEAI